MRQLRATLFWLVALGAAIWLVWRFEAQWTAAASLIVSGWIYAIERTGALQLCERERGMVERLIPYLTPKRISSRTGQIIYQFTESTNRNSTMNVSQLIANLIGQGLAKIPNQSAQTQADAQAAASALGVFLADLAKDELLHELQTLPVAALLQKMPQLSALVKQS